jgi:hypothetical protein
LLPPLPQTGRPLGRCWISDLPSGFNPDPYLSAAERILGGRFDIFALRDVQLEFPPRFNRDPKTGIIAPTVRGKALDYRDERIVGDIKYLWEQNRHYELVTLAQAFYLSRDNRYALACRQYLESWFEQCPYPLGQAWSSALENAIRLVNWAVAWHLLAAAGARLFDGDDGQAFKHRWLGSIYRHCRFIAANFSFYSSANNHLFGEYMGLFVATTTWSCWKESTAWQRVAREGLEREALKQNAPDGVNREQGIWYHHEVADMMLISGLFARANGIEFSRAYWKRLESMLEFIFSMMDGGGNVPMIGDSDDAVMVRFSHEENFDVYRSLLATGAVLFGRGDFGKKAGRFDDKSRWLTGDRGAVAFAISRSRANPREPTRAFPEGGYYVLGRDFDTPREIRIAADAGPLGYLSIAAHGHADALAFTLSVGDRPMLIDPGTYAYHTQKKWRDYFRGTAAHNTVRIDGLDQSEPGGNFMWLRKAKARCEQWETGADRDLFAGSHDGYMRLRDPVVHRRKISLNKRERLLFVEDVFECRGTHDIEFCWHFAESCAVRASASAVLAACGNVELTMAMPGGAGIPELAFGREDPPLGWISCRFDERVPAPSVVWKEEIKGTTKRTTVFRIIIHNRLPDAALENNQERTV